MKERIIAFLTKDTLIDEMIYQYHQNLPVALIKKLNFRQKLLYYLINN